MLFHYFQLHILGRFGFWRNGNGHHVPASVWKMGRARGLQSSKWRLPRYPPWSTLETTTWRTWKKHIPTIKSINPMKMRCFFSCISMCVSSFVGWWFQSLFVLRTWSLCWKEVLHPYCQTASMNHRWPHLGFTNRICDVTLAGWMGKKRSNSQDHD